MLTPGQKLRHTLDFLLYDWLDAHGLCVQGRYSEHSRETFGAVLDLAEKIAAEKFAPYNRLVDTEEPSLDGDKVILPAATQAAWNAYRDSGLLAASQPYAAGGMQLPAVIESAANSFFAMASVSIGSQLLSVSNARTILAYGNKKQQEIFANKEFSGEWAGTMCLSEPQAGSSLSDISCKAILEDADDVLGARYRLFGNKMWISSGEHELTPNIVHLVLAKIPHADGSLPSNTRGISLFIVTKYCVNSEGQNTERNDVSLAGLNHKCGWRGTTNTLLNFGEGKHTPLGKAGAVAYLVGKPGEGLRAMFHMMNEARIGIGMAATMLGMAGFYASLHYAKERRQGRLPAMDKHSQSAQVLLIEHADIKRMLLAQKAYCEGSLALCLYAAKLVDSESPRDKLLLELLIPIVKSYPSEFCLEANSLAIQIHGGYGYTRDFPVEQYWRDNRLNMIHEGTHGIQALDLLGRKIGLHNGDALRALGEEIASSIRYANKQTGLKPYARELDEAWAKIVAVSLKVQQMNDPQRALANATPFMQAFGTVVIAWIWLQLAAHGNDAGRTAAFHYFYRYELYKIYAWLPPVEMADPTCLNTTADIF
ncbi:MAG: hypothetical protein RLZZ502_432 [Pseudomonadota bacterium]